MISVIVPVYNIEKYVKPCLDSILASSYQNYELILVDDGSTDNSGAICDDYSQKYERIRVLHKSNGGLSDARNAGLQVATGEYVLFIDGDDIIHPSMIQVLFDAIKSNDYDISMVYGAKVCEEEYQGLMNRVVDENTPMFEVTQEDFHKRLFDISSIQYQVAWNKLYKKSLISGMSFIDVISEDIEWNNRVCLRLHKAIVVEAELYFYLQRAGSIMHSSISRKSIGRINTFMFCLKSIPNNLPAYRASCMTTMYSVMFLIRYNVRNTEFSQLANHYCRDVYKQTKSELINSDYIGWSKKLRMLCNYHLPSVYKVFMDKILKKHQVVLQ